MGKEYKRKHGRRKRRKKSERKKKRRSRSSRHVASRHVPGFRKRRRYAAQPLRGPADVLHHNKTEYALLGQLARQLLGPRYPPPNKLTQQGPPFLSYDPWSQQRRAIQAEEKNKELVRRQAQERAVREAPVGEEYGELGI